MRLAEGWSAPLEWNLQNKVNSDADWQDFDLTGYTLAALVYGADDSQVSTAGKTAVEDAATGKVSWTPGAMDLPVANSPYRLWWVATTGGMDYYFPHGEPEVIHVVGTP